MPDTKRIDALRKIVRECQAARVEGTLVDLFTASAMVAVHDALSPANKLATFCLSKTN